MSNQHTKPEARGACSWALNLPFAVSPRSIRLALDTRLADAGSREVFVSILRREPGLAARVLYVANSPVMGLSSAITSINAAVTWLGTGSIRSVIISTPVWTPGAAEREIVRRAIVCAALASCVGSAAEVASREDLYAAGLLYDIGELALARRERGFRPSSGGDGACSGANRSALDAVEANRQLADAWMLPEPLRSCVARRPAREEGVPALGMMVSKAHEWAQSLSPGEDVMRLYTPENLAWLSRLGAASGERFEAALREAGGITASLCGYLTEPEIGQDELIALLQESNELLGDLQLIADARRLETGSEASQISLLHDLTNEIAEGEDIQEKCDRAVNMLAERLGMGVVSVMLERPEGGLFVQSAVGLPREVVGTADQPAHSEVAAWVVAHGQPLFVEDIAREPGFHPSWFGERYFSGSVLSVPVQYGAETLGALNVNNKRAGAPFTGEDLNLFVMVGRSLGASLHLERERKQREVADQRLRDLAGRLPIALAGFDHEGKVWLWNAGMRALTGIPDAEALRRPAPAAFQPDGSPETVWEWIDAFRRGDSIHGDECTVTAIDGRQSHVLYHVFPLENNTLGVWAAVDISREKRARYAALRRADEIKATQKALQNILSDLTETNLFESLTQHAAQAAGADRAMAVMRDRVTGHLELAAWHGFENAARARKLFERYAEDVGAPPLALGRVCFPDLRLRVLAAGIERGGEVSGALCVFQPAETPYDRNSERILGDLASIAGVGLRVLDAQVEQVRHERLRAISGMAVTYNHHVNNSLQVIQGVVDLLRIREALTSNEMTAALDDIEEAAHDIARVNELLRRAAAPNYRAYADGASMVELDLR